MDIYQILMRDHPQTEEVFSVIKKHGQQRCGAANNYPQIYGNG
jgi:hypothetical protein